MPAASSPTTAARHSMPVTVLTVDAPTVRVLVTDPEKTDGERASDYRPSSAAAMHDGSGRQLIHPISGQPHRAILFGATTAPTFIRFQRILIIPDLSGFIRICRVRLRYPGEITSS
jgi:hypothetical protein